jgi:RNA polymerase sigma-70 factor (ECF subfamily)
MEPLPCHRPLLAEQACWFAEQVQPHEPALRAYLRKHFPALRDIDDVVQECYVRLFRVHGAKRVRHPKAYLFAMARNAAVDFLRHRQCAPIDELAEIERLPVLEERPDAAAKASHNHELALLQEAIAALPGRCREILTLRKMAGLSHREIAQKLNLSENTVNNQLTIAVVRCRAYFRSKGGLRSPDA